MHTDTAGDLRDRIARIQHHAGAAAGSRSTGLVVWSGRMLVAHDNGITIDAATGDVLAPRKGDHRMSEQFDIVIDPVLISPPTMLVGDTPEIYNERCRHSVQWKHYRLDQRVNHDWSTPFDPEQWPGEPAEPPGGAVTRLVAPWRGSSPPPED